MIRGSWGLSPEPAWGVRGQASPGQGGQNRHCTPEDPGYPVSHHMAPHATKSHQGGPGCSCCRTRLPQTQAQGTGIRANSRASSCPVHRRAARGQSRRGNAGRTAGQTERLAPAQPGPLLGLQPSFLSCCFLAPPCCCRGNLEQPVPMEPPLGQSGPTQLAATPQGTGGHRRPRGLAQCDTPTRPWEHPRKSLPPQVPCPHRHALALPTHQALDPEKPHPPGPGGPTAPFADVTPAPSPKVGRSAHPHHTAHCSLPPRSASRWAHLATHAWPQTLHS